MQNRIRDDTSAGIAHSPLTRRGSGKRASFDIKVWECPRGGSYRRRIIHRRIVAHLSAARLVYTSPRPRRGKREFARRRSSGRETKVSHGARWILTGEGKKKRSLRREARRDRDEAQRRPRKNGKCVRANCAARRRQATRDADTSFPINQK